MKGNIFKTANRKFISIVCALLNADFKAKKKTVSIQNQSAFVLQANRMLSDLVAISIFVI